MADIITAGWTARRDRGAEMRKALEHDGDRAAPELKEEVPFEHLLRNNSGIGAGQRPRHLIREESGRDGQGKKKAAAEPDDGAICIR